MLASVGGGAFIGEVRRRVRLCFKLGVDGFVLLFGEDLFRHQLILEEPNGVVLVLVFLDLLLLAVAALVLRVGHRVPVVAIGVEFDDRRPRLFVSALERPLGDGSHFVEVLAVGLLPFDPKGLRPLGETFVDHRGAIKARAHRIFVVLDDVNHRQIEQRRHIETFVKAALIDGAVTEEAQGRARQPFILYAVSESQTQRRLTSDDAVSAPEILVRREKVHRAALAFRAAGGLCRKAPPCTHSCPCRKRARVHDIDRR